MDNIQADYRISVIEALVLSSPEPLPAKKISEIVEDMTPTQVTGAIEELNNKYLQIDASFRIREISGGFQCYITEEYAPFVNELKTRRRNTRLSRPALETLAIVAYRQPVTKIDVEMIRGVASDSAIHTLLERKLVTMAGRAQTIGRPLLYKTTDEFLKYFNLNALKDLPQMSEIEELIASETDSAQQHLPLGPFTDKEENEAPELSDANQKSSETEPVSDESSGKDGNPEGMTDDIPAVPIENEDTIANLEQTNSEDLSDVPVENANNDAMPVNSNENSDDDSEEDAVATSSDSDVDMAEIGKE